jgi:hypothetical protein
MKILTRTEYVMPRIQKRKPKVLANGNINKHLLILNATEHDSYKDTSVEPTKFCKAFLLMSTIYRAKEALEQGLKADKEIVFFPTTAFAALLYTIDFLWHSPDQSSRIRLFHCTESVNPVPDHVYALLEKLDKSDVQRASKKTLEISTSFSSALWMLKNMQAVTSLFLVKTP